jgi:phosphatidylinositol alpha-1,6-mannosyltransferase
LVNALREAGIPIQVIAPSYPDLPPLPAQRDTHRIFGHHRITLLAALRSLQIIRKAPPGSIILAADIRSAILVYALRVFHSCRYRVLVHGSEASKFVGRSSVSKLIRRIYFGADLVCYNSVATREIFYSGIGRPSRDAVAHLGVEGHWFDPVSGPFDHPELVTISEHAVVICSVGRIEPRKGQLETVRILAHARDVHGLPDPVYVIAGRAEDTAYADLVAQEAESLSIRLLAPGRLTDVDLKRLYHRSLCHCLFALAMPGRIEGFGLVLLEAAAQKCPSVSTLVGGIPEVIGDTGLLVNAGDIESAAHAVASFFASAEMRRRKAALAFHRAKQFTWRRCAAETFPELQINGSAWI